MPEGFRPRFPSGTVRYLTRNLRQRLWDWLYDEMELGKRVATHNIP